jgi:hypothetical protein
MGIGDQVHSAGWLPFKANNIWIFLCLDHRQKNASLVINPWEAEQAHVSLRSRDRDELERYYP